ncbi:hypothetical protein B0A48_09048 [Cryoendolithus antarcticus]|uniref:Uncharacterized protein n=1 Tax=Cryoendolithus antarcticus TaxID=1507870 RepID=A0A1V8T1Z5_9PEZI|nr:hypothetical protein B0A48_09048 [Cryoendolithus antarcticus]
MMQHNTFQEGMVAWLPSSADKGSSLLACQRHMGVGAVNHPCVIIQLDDPTSEALCLQMTSFSKYIKSSTGQQSKVGNMTITEKYPYDSTFRKQYLPISQANSAPHDGLPALELANGTKMSAQSYVKLDGFFRIELANLTQYKSNTLILTEHTMCNLMHHFNKFLDGALGRLRPALNIVSPLWDSGLKPELTADNKARAEKGKLFATGELQDDSGKSMAAIPSAYKPPVYSTPTHPIEMYPTNTYETPMYETPMYEAPMYDTLMCGASTYWPSAYGSSAYDIQAYNTQAYKTQAFDTQAYNTQAYNAQAYTAPAQGGLTWAAAGVNGPPSQRPTAYRSASTSSYGSSVNGDGRWW